MMWSKHTNLRWSLSHEKGDAKYEFTENVK